MIDLQIAMFKYILHWVFIFWLGGSLNLLGQQVLIDSPRPGEALQGQVSIIGTTDIEGIKSFEVSFAYQRDDTNTWFLIGQGEGVFRSQTLAVWDTTTISDGIYRLRIRVFLNDGRTLESVITGLRVRNYTPIETNTPEPERTHSPGEVTTRPTDYLPMKLTSTVEAERDLQVTTSMLGNSLVRGGFIALVIFMVLAVYLGLRSLFRRG